MRPNQLLASALILFGSLASAPAHATCSYSLSSISNGTTADAGPVMGNFNYILQCPNFIGPIGVGEPSPVTLLDLVGIAGGAQLRLASPQSTGSTQMLFQGTGRSWYMGVGNAGETTYGLASKFYVFDDLAHVPRLTIDTAGNVGLGTTAPSTSLAIKTASSDAAIFLDSGGGNSSGIYFDNNGQSGAQMGMRVNGNGLNFVTGSPTVKTTVAILNNAGRLGIGTASPGQKLDVVGTIRQSNCTTAGTLSTNASGDIICTSDARLKNVLGDYAGGLNALVQITPALFTYKPTAANPVETFVHAGFIAQNVRRAIPQAVAVQRNGYLSLDTTAILAASVNAIKELKAANERQAVEIARLRQQNVDAIRKLEHQVAKTQGKLAAMERASAVHTAAAEYWPAPNYRASAKLEHAR